MLKRLAADSSSLILLQKVGAFPILLENFSVVISESVFAELTRKNHHNSFEFGVIQQKVVHLVEKTLVQNNLGKGEHDTILLYLQNDADFVLVDDKKGIYSCRKKNIPFINALLIPPVLFDAQRVSKGWCDEKFTKLAQLGYYSEEIIAKAKQMTTQDFYRFSPALRRG